MEQKRPKRRKDKYNPYTICRMNGKYYICFYNVQKEKICIEISKELSKILYLIFDYLHKHYTFERFEV